MNERLPEDFLEAGKAADENLLPEVKGTRSPASPRVYRFIDTADESSFKVHLP